ncbi:MAG: YnbE family lipoprotein [Tistlia sp.]|uniref:YnbE family lipoprotein n=1 Tax=Tistlia sp. TaxID=3057121 RepID=UPI0034A51E8F
MLHHISRSVASPFPLRDSRIGGLGLALAAAGLLAACQPTVRLEAPREPITINLNVKLDADVRVRLEEKAREDITENPEIF